MNEKPKLTPRQRTLLEIADWTRLMSRAHSNPTYIRLYAGWSRFLRREAKKKVCRYMWTRAAFGSRYKTQCGREMFGATKGWKCCPGCGGRIEVEK